MIADCPHCLNRVYFPADGICPACHASVHSTEGADYMKTRFTIYESDSVPHQCYLCAAPTERTVKWTHAITHFQEKRSFLRFFSFKHMFFDLLNKAASYDEQMSICLPQCEACKNEPKAVDFSEDVDFPERRATFVVHRDFAEQTKFRRAEQT